MRPAITHTLSGRSTSDLANRNHKKRRRVFHPFRRASRPGAVPGTIRPPKDALQTHLRAAVYDTRKTKTHDDVALDQIGQLQAAAASTSEGILWLDVDGAGDGTPISEIGQQFGLHDLALEDVVNVHQRAKVEEFENHLFIVARMVAVVDGRVETEQISLFLGDRFVLSFQERPGDCLDALRRRLRARDSRLRRHGADFLAYAILDAIVDNYFPVLEYYGDLLDTLEERVEQRDVPGDVVRQLHQIRSDLLVLRRSVWPHREMVGSLLRTDHPLMTANTRLYLRDIYDHTVQLLDVTETYREICADLRELHYAQVGQRTNDVMRVLTMISTFFIPLSFITGLYGMNFNTRSPYNMPELDYPYGYPVLLAVMAVFAVSMLAFFWRKGWIWRRQ